MVKSSTRARLEPSVSGHQDDASKQIDEMIKVLRDWRGKTLAKVRQVIKEADPEIIEEIKWKKPTNPAGVPVWSHNGGICTGEIYKGHLKFTFFKGASLEDPSHLFTQPGTVRRAIDFHEGDMINETALKNLIRAAVALNLESKAKR
ncbi:MAG TPA: DUF1801 domain-containing protein [Nitrososphaerales archaeon]|nr:DUF1801 domain-containing protein [Nitrososphaerales archaeon]